MKNSLFNLKDKIKDIIEDRYPGKLSLGELENISDRVITEESFSKLSNVSKLSLEILWLMNGQNGQILRFIFSNYDYVGAGYLKKIYKWSTSFLDTDFQIDSIDSMEVPDFFIDLADRDEIKVRDVIERIFICKTKEVDFYKEKENKVNLFEKQNLSVDSIKTIIQETGTVPLNNIDEKNIIKVLNILRKLESDKKVGSLAKYQRSGILNYIFEKEIAENIKSKHKKGITLDSKGIFINLREFHNHLPFGLISETCLSSLIKKDWISKEEWIEISLREKTENNLISRIYNIKEKQEKYFYDYLRKIFGDNISKESLLKETLDNPNYFFETIYKDKIIIPDLFLESLMDKETYGGYFSLLTIAQKISTKISELSEDDLYENLSPIARGQLQSEYDRHSVILYHEDYYNASKITKFLINRDIKTSSKNKFLVFQGQFGKKNHSFLESVYEGNLARILFENKENKVINITTLKQEEYIKIESKLRAFNSVKKTFERVSDKLDKNRLSEIPLIDIESMLTFLLTNSPKNLYQESYSVYRDNFKDGTQDKYVLDDLKRFMDIVGESINLYEDFFYKNIEKGDFLKGEYVKALKVEYGDEYLKQISDIANPRNFDVNLSLNSEPIRVALVDSGLNSETIPFHLEESALDTIRIDRNRPLINVIGGCKNVGDFSFDPLDHIAKSVISFAHKIKANIGVPGTQSGIGVAFGEHNSLYKEKFGYLPLKDQARMFSIVSGRDVFFPGNKYIKEGDHLYGLTPVDSIVTKHRAGWDLKGSSKRESGYKLQIQHMESFYKRMCSGKNIDKKQPRVSVVGNGGLYSIWEIDEIIEDDFDIFLIAGSGRFADVASYVLERVNDFDNWEDINKSSEFIFEILSEVDPDSYIDQNVVDEFKTKDFGDSVYLIEDNADQTEKIIYREAFFKFMKLALKNRERIHITDIINLESNLETIL